MIAAQVLQDSKQHRCVATHPFTCRQRGNTACEETHIERFAAGHVQHLISAGAPVPCVREAAFSAHFIRPIIVTCAYLQVIRAGVHESKVGGFSSWGSGCLQICLSTATAIESSICSVERIFQVCGVFNAAPCMSITKNPL
jgi:hypothetical protein